MNKVSNKQWICYTGYYNSMKIKHFTREIIKKKLKKVKKASNKSWICSKDHLVLLNWIWAESRQHCFWNSLARTGRNGGKHLWWSHFINKDGDIGKSRWMFVWTTSVRSLFTSLKLLADCIFGFRVIAMIASRPLQNSLVNLITSPPSTTTSPAIISIIKNATPKFESTRQEVFYKTVVLKLVTKFTETYLRWHPYFSKVTDIGLKRTSSYVFSCEL